MGIYLGKSPIHNPTVALVLHAQKGYVSPQFHVKMDPSFHSVRPTTRQDKVKILWPVRTGFVEKQVQHVTKTKSKKRDRKITATLASEGGGRIPSSEGGRLPSTEGGSDKARASKHMSQRDQPTAPELPDPNGIPKGSGAHDTNEPWTRLGRSQQSPQRLIEVMEAELTTSTKDDIPGELFTYPAMCPIQRDPTMDEHPLLYMKATASGQDTMYLHEAMKEPDALDYKKAMQTEVKDQTEGKVFRLMQQSQVPKEQLSYQRYGK
jgi:hypothetical protein